MSRLHSRSIDSCSPHDVAPMHRARSQMDMNAAYADMGPIYQTSAPLYSTAPQRYPPQVTLHAPSPASGPLLPAFLQDMFQPPSLSPASTSSADISADDYTTSPTSLHGTQTQLHERQVPRKGSGSSLNIAKGSIWRMDGEESRVFASPVTPAHGMVVGADRKNMEPAWA
ncbi:hypothetical protein EWM64_g2935 [Hericium alpestre]|uniref:Uncharacterized protein n=1 Tax=Hericium alpestre TaxID=135208 RepID=A0A4Z0A1Z9_9AGAM|nr:hypothetical protein EWM64_g2935 [Hericium alpestre]